jgi:lipoprotein-anchoring transpeptidase ErfK/SrfK
MKPTYSPAVAFSVIAASLIGVAALTHAQSRPSPAQPVEALPVSPSADRLAEALPSLDEETRRGLALQVALDRSGFSPGEIDGAPGANTERALAAFKAARGTSELGEAYENSVTTYTITQQDVAGPFSGTIPDDMVEKSELPSLSYTSVLEMLGERFHASPKLLQRLNPAATFAAGEVIIVPNVEPFVPPGPKTEAAPPDDAAARGAAQETDAARVSAGTDSPGRPDAAVTVTVTDRTRTLQVQDAAGTVIFHAPVTVGSENDPLPIGEWTINGVGRNPEFNYNPDLFWDADPSHAKAKIAPGPNNPVGVVWIDLSKEHYGIHGTPEPSRVGHTQSHGCIRLTNWDAMRVAELVTPGTKVVLR